MTGPTLEELLADLAPHIAICRRSGCRNRGKRIVVLAAASAPSAACGACVEDGVNTPITDLSPTEE